MIFRKYEFLPSKWAELQSKIQVEISLGEETHLSYNPDLVNSVVEIGHIMIEPPVLNADMTIKKEAVLSDKYSVDILWQDEPLEDFEPYEIWCEPIGTHSFGASIDQEYIDSYNARQ